jgi:hypothetical protein
MGIEHERIHLETSSVLIRQHALQRVRPLPAWAPDRSGLDGAPTPAAAPVNSLASVASGRVRLGKSCDDPLYGWDNEYGRREVETVGLRGRPHAGQQCRVPRPSSRPAATPTPAGGTRRAMPGAASRRLSRRPSGCAKTMPGGCA